ncbi:MAG TPA: CHASE2 domain-containing protein [Stellaceae bacterium]|nr:CHASE2 domain-containing protein [Stellaceae bacterium]
MVALLLVLRALDPGPVEEARLRGFDLEERLAPRVHRPAPVVVVAIDEDSLKPPYGQWPWPRTLLARLVDRIAAGGARALGVDILFSEPDRASPEQIARNEPSLPGDLKSALDALPSNDATLAAAFAKLPTVLGVGPTFEAPPGQNGRFAAPPIRSTGDPRPFLASFPALVRSLPLLEAAAKGPGGLAVDPDGDGVVRRVPLFFVGGGDIIATLAAATLDAALGSGPMLIRASSAGVAGARVGAYEIPTDEHGRAFPYFAPAGSVPTVSAADILSGRFNPAALAGDVVFLGVTGLGLVDRKETPLGLMQGVEVHAQLLESILQNQLLRRPAVLSRIEMVLLVGAGLLVIFGLPYRRPAIAAAATGAIVGLCLAAGFIAFRFAHLLLDGAYPGFVSVATFGVMVAANLRHAEAEKRRLADALEHQRIRTLRLEAELDHARAIQRGLLPKELADTPEARSIDLHALIESARMVGGDLYDFLVLDGTHLFFAIADVSGKGMPAAIFMMETKEVLHAATFRHGGALDRVFEEANRKICAKSADAEAEGARPTFVTVFAALLDLVTGEISFASAGHDAPYVLRRGAAPFRLETEGGPPLGCLDDSDYPIDRAQLAPGDVLLLYTDGITEARDPANALYSTARLEAMMAASPTANAKAVVEHVREDVRRFVADAEQADDITLLAVRWRGPLSA